MRFLRKILFSFLWIIFLFNHSLYGCESITSNASDMLRLVNYVCLESNATDMYADVIEEKFYLVDENSTLRSYEMSKSNYPVTNSLRLTYKDNIEFAMDSNATSVVAVNNKIFVGGLDGAYMFGDNGVGSLSLLDKNETTFSGRAATLYNKYILIADRGNIKIVDSSYTSLSTLLGDPFNSVSTGIISEYIITDGDISDLHVYKNYLYVSYLTTSGATLVGKLQRYHIILENGTIVLEDKRIYNITASDIYANDEYLFVTKKPFDLDNRNTDQSSVEVYKLDDLSSSAVFSPSSREATFIVGDKYYRIEVGLNGLIVYDKSTDTIVASDTSFQGDKILSIGEHIIVTDFSTSHIRVYKFGKIGVNTNEGLIPFESEFFITKYNLDTISWSFGDGASYSSAEQKAYHLYPILGTYIAEINTTYKNDLKDSNGNNLNNIFRITMNAVGSNIPVLGLSASTIRGQLPLKVDFDSNITYSSYIDSRKWYLGDGNTSNLKSFSHTFNTAGDYNVSFVAFYDNDKNVTKNIIISVLDGGSIDISYKAGSDIASINELISFSYVLPTQITEDNISNVSWSFGDGGHSNVADSKYTYKNGGVYIVLLSITTKDGELVTITKDLTVYADALHYIEATPFIGESPLAVDFQIKTSTNITGVSYIKSAICFGTGGTISYSDSFSKTYDKEGDYEITCNVTLNDGKKKVLKKKVTVNNNVSLEVTPQNSNIKEDESISFVSKAVARSGVKNIIWDFGDGIKFIGASAYHKYSKSGTYRGTATLTTNKNHTAVREFFVEVSKKSTTTSTNQDTKTDTTISKTEVSIYATQLDSVYSYKFEAIIENYSKDIDSYWWEFRTNIKSATNQTTAKYIFSSFHSYTVVFKIKYSDNSITSHKYVVTPTYNKLEIVLRQGWNMISAPTDIAFDTRVSTTVATTGSISMKVLKNNYVPLVWVFVNNRWASNPNFIPSKIGIWVKSNINNNKLYFNEGKSYLPKIASLSKNRWHLIGTGTDIVDFQNKYDFYIEKSFTYENTFFTPEPYLVRRGQGIWLLTKP